MIRTIKEFFELRIQRPSVDGEPSERPLQLATAALLVEISRADQRVNDEERRAIADAVRRCFDLSPDETTDLLRLAEEEATAAVSMFQFTSLIDKGFSREQKTHIVELLWRVAYADAEKASHEEHVIRRIADLLHVSHKDFIEAKIKAREAPGA